MSEPTVELEYEAHMSDIPARYKVNGKSYDVSYDSDSEDPRSWVDEEFADVYVYQSAAGVMNDLRRKSDNYLTQRFMELYEELGTGRKALVKLEELEADYIAQGGWNVDILQLPGGAQGEWAYAFVASKDGYGTAQSHADQYEQWRCGEVYQVTDVASGECIGGIYADSEEEAVKQALTQF